MIAFEEYITEIMRKTLMNNTGKGRKKRAEKALAISSPKVIEMDDGLEKMEYRIKMRPPKLSKEGKRHLGYVIYDPETEDIKELWCDCKDFQYRLVVPYLRSGMSKIEVQNKKMLKSRPFKNNGEWTDETNPSGKLFLCKHLYQLFDNYF